MNAPAEIALPRRLTRAQRQIVEHIAAGWKGVEIAAALGMDAGSVSECTRRACARLDCSNRAELVCRAIVFDQLDLDLVARLRSIRMASL